MGCIGCCGGCGRCCVAFINILLIVLFLIIILAITGIWLVPDNPIMATFEDDVKSNIKSFVLAAGTATSVPEVDAWHLPSFSLFTLLLHGVWGLAGAGLMISFCGCIASCCKLKCCICSYAVIVTILFAGQVILVLLHLSETSPLKSYIEGAMEPTFTSYKGLESLTDDDIGWSFTMWKNLCCGVYGYDQSLLTSNSATLRACCSYSPGDIVANMCTGISTINKVGCGNEIFHLVAGDHDFSLYVPALFGIQILLIFSSICMCLKMKMKNQVQDDLDERKPPPDYNSHEPPQQGSFPTNDFVFVYTAPSEPFNDKNRF